MSGPCERATSSAFVRLLLCGHEPSSTRFGALADLDVDARLAALRLDPLLRPHPAGGAHRVCYGPRPRKEEKKLLEKWRRYAEYSKNGGHLEKFGVSKFRVLCVAERQEGDSTMLKLMLPLRDRQPVAQGTMSFAFDLEGQSFPFTPGQYNTVTIPNPLYQDEEGNTRQFSIASSPWDPFILIVTRMRASAFKRTFAEVPLGTRVNFRGPLGSFTLPQDAADPMVLIAGGIGITPFRSMVKHTTEHQLPHRLTLIYSNRTPQEAPFLDELRDWERTNPNFRFIPTMTSPEPSALGWTGRTGYVDAAFLRETLEDLDRYVFYAAGPPRMVHGVKQALLEAGVAEDRFRTEEFSGY